MEPERTGVEMFGTTDSIVGTTFPRHLTLTLPVKMSPAHKGWLDKESSWQELGRSGQHSQWYEHLTLLFVHQDDPCLQSLELKSRTTGEHPDNSLGHWLILFWPLTGLKFRLKLEKSFCPRMDRVASWVASPKDLINFYLSTFYLLLCSCTVEIDNRSWNVEETWQIGEVKTIFAKDDYNSETHENDIAILRLLIH